MLVNLSSLCRVRPKARGGIPFRPVAKGVPLGQDRVYPLPNRLVVVSNIHSSPPLIAGG